MSQSNLGRFAFLGSLIICVGACDKSTGGTFDTDGEVEGTGAGSGGDGDACGQPDPLSSDLDPGEIDGYPGLQPGGCLASCSARIVVSFLDKGDEFDDSYDELGRITANDWTEEGVRTRRYLSSWTEDTTALAEYESYRLDGSELVFEDGYRYVYDEHLNETTVYKTIGIEPEQPWRLTENTYDNDGRLVHSDLSGWDEEAGDWKVSTSGRDYTYTNAGELESYAITYDGEVSRTYLWSWSDGRVVHRNESQASDGEMWDVSFTWDDEGRLSGVFNDDDEQFYSTFEYDGDGRMTAILGSSAGNAHQFNFTWACP